MRISSIIIPSWLEFLSNFRAIVICPDVQFLLGFATRWNTCPGCVVDEAAKMCVWYLPMKLHKISRERRKCQQPFWFFWSFQKLQIGPKRNLGVVVDLLMIGAPQLRVGEVDDETKGVQSLIPHPSWLGSRLQPGFLSPSLMDCFGT